MNLGDAVALRDVAKAKGVATTIGLQTRAVPAFAYMRDLIGDGYVGDVLSRLRFASDFKGMVGVQGFEPWTR